MSYLQLNGNNEPLRVVPAGNVLWDETHFCPVEALTAEEADFFRVYKIHPAVAPIYDENLAFVVMDGYEVNADGNWTERYSIVNFTPQEIQSRLQKEQSINIKRIEDDVDSIRNQAIGTKATEYLRAESDARAFKSANYTGVVPNTVAVWAEVKEWSAQQAADNIIATADLWLQVEDTMRAHRLREKEAIRKATTSSEIITIIDRWVAFTNIIKGQLGL